MTLSALARSASCCVIAGAAFVLARGKSARNVDAQYVWTKVVDSTSYPGSYNFPVFVVGNEMWAFHSEGGWRSSDAKTWMRTPIPPSGLNSAYQRYVVFNNAVYALGTMQGNYLNLQLTSRIQRTRDFRTWETVSAESNLPKRVFYGAVVYQGKIWLMGGYDGAKYYNDVWNSPDAVHWTRVAEHAAWSPRNTGVTVVFRNRLWMIGGDVIDGQRNSNPNSTRETWSSADGVSWARAPERAGRVWGGAPVEYDGKLWLIGANRNETFAPATLSSDDAVTWSEQTAPWPARGAPSVWVFQNRLYMTGGKYSEPVNGQPRFIYRNDVWYMSPSR